ncbi:MAG: hypothetical protein IT379_14850 [Deltaproteobacteria bacterium]|nr:hypothetical protein [Deltaproteobacteria bacterium]
MLYTHRIAMDEMHYGDTARLALGTRTPGSTAIGTEQYARSFAPSLGRGGMLRGAAGTQLTARIPIYEGVGPAMTLIAFETLYSADGLSLENSIHQEPISGGAVSTTFDAAGVAVGTQTWIVSSTSTGLIGTEVTTGAEFLVPTRDSQPEGEVRLGGLPDGTLVVGWSQRTTPADSWTARAAVIRRDASVATVATVFEAPLIGRDEIDMLVHGDSVYLARFERDPMSLRDGRLRIARLNSNLERVEADRWIAGWGGLAPSGVALVEWQGAAWMVFHTLDPRFGATPVLYIAPLAGDACGYSVNQPAMTLPASAAGARDLVAAIDGQDMWIAVAYLDGPGTATLLQAQLCN